MEGQSDHRIRRPTPWDSRGSWKQGSAKKWLRGRAAHSLFTPEHQPGGLCVSVNEVSGASAKIREDRGPKKLRKLAKNYTHRGRAL